MNVLSNLELSELRLSADAVGEIDGETTEAFHDLDNVDVSTSDGSSSNDSQSDNIDGDVLDLISAGIS